MKKFLYLLLIPFFALGQNQDVLTSAGKSPSLEAMRRTYERAILNGGATQDFSANIENIRDISRDLNYNILQDATFVYVPSSYAESKNFGQFNSNSITGSDFEFTRATASRVTNKQGIIEDSAYSLLQLSEDLSNAYWTKNSVTVSTVSILNPFGVSQSINKVIPVSSPPTFSTNVSRNISIVGTTYTLSAYFKAGEYNYGFLQTNSGSNDTTFFNLTNGTVSFQGSNITSCTVVSIGNGWYRCSMTQSLTTATNAIRYGVSGNPTPVGSLGDGVSGAFVWGVQFEQGNLRPYLRTTNRLNVPCLDYSRGLLEPGLLTKPQRTNLLLHSGTIDNAVWVLNGSSINANTVINPFGENKGYYLTETNTGTTHSVTQSAALTSGTTYTVSFYIKKANDSWIQIALGTGFAAVGTAWVNFNFDTGNFGNTGTTGAWTKKQLTNGYWLLTLTDISSLTGTGNAAVIFGTNNTDSATRGLVYAGLTDDLCNIAAMQVEVGANATAYIPTTTATVTRNGENNFVDLFNNSLLNQNNFTLFWEGYLYNGQATNMSFCLSDTSTASTNSNQIGWFESVQPFYNIGGVRTNSGISILEYSPSKLAIQYNNGTVTFYVDGVSVWTQSVAVFNYRYLILNNGGSTFATDKIVLFNRTLSNAECTTLTTP